MWSLQHESRREEGHGVASHGLGPHHESVIKVSVLCWNSDIAEEEKASSFTMASSSSLGFLDAAEANDFAQ